MTITIEEFCDVICPWCLIGNPRAITLNWIGSTGIESAFFWEK